MLVGMSLVITFIVVCVSPIMVLVMARFVGLQSRTAIYTALLSNSLGETTLTLQVLAYQAGMLGRDSFLVLVMSTMWSMNLCSVGSMKIESLMTKLQPLLGPFLDRPTRAEKEREAARRRKMGGVLRGHVVILGFNETGQEIAEYFREQKKEVCVVDLDPCLHRCFKQAFKGVASKPKPRCPPIDPNKMPATTSKRIQNKFKMITAVRTAARLRATGKLRRGLQGHGAGEGKEHDGGEGRGRDKEGEGVDVHGAGEAGVGLPVSVDAGIVCVCVCVCVRVRVCVSVCLSISRSRLRPRSLSLCYSVNKNLVEVLAAIVIETAQACLRRALLARG